jgi:four helix bundle protein
VNDFRKLKVWEKAHALTLAIYRETSGFPREELYGITSQMRRASASVAANIAEGYGRGRDGEFHHFLTIAAGSAVELEYFLLLSFDLKILSAGTYHDMQQQILEVQRMLSGLLRKVADQKKQAALDAGSAPVACSS